jgi:hypothetical protein
VRIYPYEEAQTWCAIECIWLSCLMWWNLGT